MADTEEQWRVTWFPPDVQQRSRTGSEEMVRLTAASASVEPWHPIVEKRTVTRSPWSIVVADGTVSEALP